MESRTNWKDGFQHPASEKSLTRVAIENKDSALVLEMVKHDFGQFLIALPHQQPPLALCWFTKEMQMRAVWGSWWSAWCHPLSCQPLSLQSQLLSKPPKTVWGLHLALPGCSLQLRHFSVQSRVYSWKQLDKLRSEEGYVEGGRKSQAKCIHKGLCQCQGENIVAYELNANSNAGSYLLSFSKAWNAQTMRQAIDQSRHKFQAALTSIMIAIEARSMFETWTTIKDSEADLSLNQPKETSICKIHSLDHAMSVFVEEEPQMHLLQVEMKHWLGRQIKLQLQHRIKLLSQRWM